MEENSPAKRLLKKILEAQKRRQDRVNRIKDQEQGLLDIIDKIENKGK